MNNLNKKRLRKCRRVSRFLAVLPFVRCVILNGSLAEGKSKENSDIDLLIIVKSGRIFTVRYLINSILTIFGIKRSKDETKSHAGCFCINYFLTERFMNIPVGRGEEMDRYCAKNYSNSIFMAGKPELFDEFMSTNRSLFEKYGYKTKPRTDSVNKWVLSNRFFELILKGKLGDWFEAEIKKWQIAKIESDPRTKEYPDLIVYNDLEMRFHPPKQN